MTDESLIGGEPEDPAVWRIRSRVRELEAEKEAKLRELRDLGESAKRIANQTRWANESIAGLTVEQDLLQAWLNATQ